jgi:hypothetical protein
MLDKWRWSSSSIELGFFFPPLSRKTRAKIMWSIIGKKKT